MNDDPITTDDFFLHCSRFGNGPEALLAFHGFGQDASVFEGFVSVFPEYTIYGFDLFFHGRSQWGGKNLLLSKKKWLSIISAFLEANGIARFSLLAYSLGAKPALSIMEAMPEKLIRAVLIAPYGVKVNFWYWLATGTRLFNMLFLKIVENPKHFFNLLEAAGTLRLIGKHEIRFVRSQMRSFDKRIKVYKTWLLYRKLNISAERIRRAMPGHAFLLEIFTGKTDGIIPFKDFDSLRKKIPDNRLRIITLDCGHNALVAETLKYYKTAIGGNHDGKQFDLS